MGKDLTIKDLLAILDNFAAFGLAEKWDNVGLMVGSKEQQVHGIFVALDPTEEILAEAKECSADCIITHHPLIFNPLKSIHTNQPLGRFLQGALKSGTAVIGCHTNLDQTAGGLFIIEHRGGKTPPGPSGTRTNTNQREGARHA